MHFILRRISSQGVEMTTVLGESYTLVTIEKSPEHFRQGFQELFKKEYEPHKDDSYVFALISTEHGESIMPLYYNQENYIMTSEGKTFHRVEFNTSPKKG